MSFDWRQAALLDAWLAPSWREAAVEYAKQPYPPRGPTSAQDKCVAASTVEALVYGLREGIEKISEGERMRRLSELSDVQILEVCERLQSFNPDIAPPWTVQQVKSLVGIWRRVHA